MTLLTSVMKKTSVSYRHNLPSTTLGTANSLTQRSNTSSPYSNYVLQVLPEKAVLDAIYGQVKSWGCDEIVSIGSGGRLDLERALVSHWPTDGDSVDVVASSAPAAGGADGPSSNKSHLSQPSLKITAIDLHDPTIVVSERVDYISVDNSHSPATVVGENTALMVCWGTSAPWKGYIESMTGPLFIVFSAVDSRAMCSPDPRRADDVSFLRRHGFEPSFSVDFEGESFCYSECRLSCFSRARH